MSGYHANIDLPSPETTARFAADLATRLRAGDVLLLSGPVGAGKTHFARHLITRLLITPEDIPSPTFTLVQTYQGASGEIWHADLYRLNDSAEIVELGLSDAFETSICLVEWPDRLGDMAPKDALTLTFTPEKDENRRRLVALWQQGDWEHRIGDLFDG